MKTDLEKLSYEQLRKRYQRTVDSLSENERVALEKKDA